MRDLGTSQHSPGLANEPCAGEEQDAGDHAKGQRLSEIGFFGDQRSKQSHDHSKGKQSANSEYFSVAVGERAGQAVDATVSTGIRQRQPLS